MMTSSVFGSIASQNLGYAKVELKETIARRDKDLIKRSTVPYRLVGTFPSRSCVDVRFRP